MVKRFVLVAAAAAAAVRAECDYTAITDLTTSTEYTQCYVDTNGYAFTSTYYDADTAAAICASSACEELFNELSNIDLTDCGVSTGDYDTLYKQACGSGASSPTASSSSTLSGDSSGDSSGGSNTGLIIGLIAGGVVLLLLIGGFVFLRKRRNKQRELADQQELSVIGDNGYKLEAAETSDQVFHQVASAPRYDTASTATGTQYSASTATGTQYSASTATGTQYSASVSRSQSHQSAVSTTSSNASNLWDDPVIIAARIPFQSIQLLSCISRGGFGEVYRAVYRDKPVAVKMLLQATRKDLHHISAFLSEIKLAAGLDHPSIVQFVGVAWESLSELYYVNEFVDGGDLRTLLASYQSTGHPYGMGPTELKIAMQVSNALTYLHSLQPMVLHRDLKSRNILLTAQLDAKITDFGASKERLDRTLTAGVGTSLWMAPEVVLGDRYDDKADVYSLGVVLFELDTHELPYDRSRTRGDDSGPLPEAAVLQLVLMGRLRLEFSPALAPELRELGGKCLNVDPKQRPSAAQVAYELHTALRARTA